MIIVLAQWNKSTAIHVAPLRHIILTPRQRVFAPHILSSLPFNGEAANTNKGNNKIIELRTILQRESQNS